MTNFTPSKSHTKTANMCIYIYTHTLSPFFLTHLSIYIYISDIELISKICEKNLQFHLQRQTNFLIGERFEELTKDNMQIAKKHLNSYSISLAFMEMKIKTQGSTATHSSLCLKFKTPIITKHY